MHTIVTRLQAPHVTFLPTYDLSAGSPRSKTTKRNGIRETPKENAKNPRAGAKPGFQFLPTGGRDGSKEMATEAKLEANGRTLFSKTIGIIVVLAR